MSDMLQLVVRCRTRTFIYEVRHQLIVWVWDHTTRQTHIGHYSFLSGARMQRLAVLPSEREVNNDGAVYQQT